MPKFIILAAVIFFITACSSTRFAYKNADWFINWALDDFVELDRQQQSAFDESLQGILAWHCEHELPRYHLYLSDLATVLGEGSTPRLTQGELQSFSERAVDAWSALLIKTLDESSPLVQGFSEAQVASVIAELERRNLRFYKDYVEIDPPALEKARVKRVKDAMKRWAGSFSKEQMQLALVWARQADNVYGLIYERREKWRGRLAELLQRRGEAGFTESLRELTLHPERLYAPAERERLLANQQSARELLLALEQSLSLKQRRHLLAELAAIAEDIERLSAPNCRLSEL